MESAVSRKRKISILLLSLAIHLILFLLLFVTLTDPATRKKWLQEQRIKLLKTLAKLPKPKPKWAATKARASQFGAPVVFSEPGEQKTKQKKQQAKEAPKQTKTATQAAKQKQIHAEKQIQKMVQQVTKQKKPIEEKTIQKITQKTKIDKKVEVALQDMSDKKMERKIEKELKKAPTTLTDNVLEKQVEKTDEPQKQETAVEKKIVTQKPQVQQQVAKKTVVQRIPPKPVEQQMAQRKTIPQPQSKPIEAKPQNKLTLAHITKGFLEQIKNKGESAVTMRGDKNRMPTDEQLKHERYLQRLQWCLQNSMKIHQRKYTPKRSVKTSLDMYLALDKEGKLTELKLLRSSGITALDEFMHFAFQDASSSFPPVPAFFKKEIYTIIFTVKINEMPQPGFRLFRQ